LHALGLTIVGIYRLFELYNSGLFNDIKHVKTFILVIPLMIVKNFRVKPDVHPELHEVTIMCTCSNSFKTRSIVKQPSRQLYVHVAIHSILGCRNLLILLEKFTKKYKK
jgi:ribosomal protein L31